MLRFSIVEITRPDIEMSRDSPIVVIRWMSSVKRANGSVSDWEAEAGWQSPSLQRLPSEEKSIWLMADSVWLGVEKERGGLITPLARATRGRGLPSLDTRS
jgi:hypothetical protein